MVLGGESIPVDHNQRPAGQVKHVRRKSNPSGIQRTVLHGVGGPCAFCATFEFHIPF